MLNRTLQLLLAGCLISGSLWAADNPFVGKWKVDPSKSMLNDEMQVEAAGANRYTFTFGPGQVDTIVADGSCAERLGIELAEGIGMGDGKPNFQLSNVVVSGGN